jgi:signal transduction histidine kinase
MKKILALRLLAIVVLILFQIVVIGLMRADPENDMQKAQVVALVGLFYSLFIFSLGMRNFLRVWKRDQKISKEFEVLTDDLVASQNQLLVLDGQLRKQIGAWLHGTVQSKLMKIARDVRNLDTSKANELAEELDDLAENDIRNYSHRLFPPTLNISLQVGLIELCEGSAELEIDPSLTEQSDSGIRLDQGVSTRESTNVPDRLVLPTSLSYAIYRVVEEALSNAKKKQSTTKIMVGIKVLGKKIEIDVNDNGEKLKSDYEGGLGTTLFDVFAKQFGGTWSLSNTTDGVAFQTEYFFEPKTVRSELLEKVKSRE